MTPDNRTPPTEVAAPDADAPLNLIVVEDERPVRQTMSIQIRTWGFEVHEAATSEEALTLLADQPIDIVVSDIRMPGMDGMELLRRVTDEYPEVDVVMITGYNMTYSYLDVVNGGATDFVIKPFEPEELRAKLQRICRERRIRRELLFHSTRDGLTGLRNRRTFQDLLRREVNRALRQKNPMSLLILDVDDLKGFNDRHGHVAGDALLQRVARCLESGLRQRVDTPFRIGGDEFAAVLVEASEEQATDIGDRIRRCFEEHDLHHHTVSLGVAAIGPDDDPESLHLRADRALYAAKSSGGNSVVGAASLPVTDSES